VRPDWPARLWVRKHSHFHPKAEGNGLANSGRARLQEDSRYADEMDPLNVAGERAELEYEQALEKRELDWLKTNKIQ